uniref:Uncharacterized protein n=1 Tax=Thermogemmatispora argillosa TaxID=2045280 RepID=A0A455T2T9_9CHLR|nr:hypothetical protein KTA_23250 [Thermogemmatispora argillosa]
MPEKRRSLCAKAVENLGISDKQAVEEREERAGAVDKFSTGSVEKSREKTVAPVI